MLNGKILGVSGLTGSINKEIASGTSDYEKLKNIPQINNVELIGNKTSEELGLDLNVENGESEYSLVQKSDDNAPKATGYGAVAFGGLRADKSPEEIESDDTVTEASGIQSYAFGPGNHSEGNFSFTAGRENRAYQQGSTAIGCKCTAGNKDANVNEPYGFSFAQGETSTASGWASCSLNNSRATGTYSFAANRASANGYGATAFGLNNVGTRPGEEDAEGDALGDYSFSAGANNWANSKYCAVLGVGNTADVGAEGALLAGRLNVARPDALYSTTFGLRNENKHQGTFVTGEGNKSTRANQLVVGEYNNNGDGTELFVVGNGDVNKRSSAFEVWKSGNAQVHGKLWIDNTCYVGTGASFGKNSLIVGTNNQVRQSNSAAIGNNCVTSEADSAAFGTGTQNNTPSALVCGSFNVGKSNMLFEVGNGQGSDGRANAFEVTSTGVARMYGEPQGDNDLTPKKYVDTKVADLVNSAPETLDTLGEVAKAIQENESVVEALNSAIGNKADKSEVTALDTRVTDLENAEAPEVDLTPIEERLTTLENKKNEDLNIKYATKGAVAIQDNGNLVYYSGSTDTIIYNGSSGRNAGTFLTTRHLETLVTAYNNAINRIATLENAGSSATVIRLPKEA